jgi:hypothetical protein
LDTNVFRARFGKWIPDREKRSTAMPSVSALPVDPASISIAVRTTTATARRRRFNN